MKWTRIVVSLVPLVLLCCLSCRGPASTQQMQEWPQIVDRARARVLGAVDLDDVSREMVRTNEPKFLVVYIPFGNYHTFQWTISSNRIVELDALINYRDLDNKPVVIRRQELAD